MFIATKACRDKIIFVATKDGFCSDKHMFIATTLLSQQKLYLWQLPLIIVYIYIYCTESGGKEEHIGVNGSHTQKRECMHSIVGIIV